MNWMRPRRTRRWVMRARCPPRNMTGEFSTLAHIIAPAMLATPGPSAPTHGPGYVGGARPGRAGAQTRLSGHARDRLGHEAGALLMMRRHHRPAACFCFEEHVDEVRVRDSEQRVDTLDFEQVQYSFVNGYSHFRTPRC